ncbi:MAG: metallophosphoesterase, partial [Deltaproteobacteria bacterium]|nr:metallophosphoesterase [Deltaproteobacteria bacterium]
MRRIPRRLVLVLSILVAGHFYIWLQLVAPLPSPWRWLGTALIVLLTPSMPVLRRFSRGMPREAARPYLLVGYLWFGLATYLLLGAVASHVAVAFGVEPVTAAVLGSGAAVATVLYGLVHVARGPRVRHVEIPLANLEVPSYTLVQLTDVHIGTMLGREFATRVVQQVNALEPDLIVITGDFVDGRLAELRPHIEPFRDLRARHGGYAVTGNHEYYWNAESWLAHLRSLGIRVLRNEHVTIADAFQLAGVDDSSANEDLPRAMEGRNPRLPLVLLAHHPRTIVRAAPAGVDLQLSGHTHGGQLLPLGWLARLFDPQVSGLGRFGSTWLYVIEGTGYWGPPMRVGTTQE